MKAVTAAVAAALLGAAAAQDWEGWSSTKEVDPVEPKTTAWSEWDDTTSTKPVDPVDPETSNWSDWEVTSTKPVDPKKPKDPKGPKTTKPVDPKEPETTWADWEATSTKPVDPKKPETTTWADWEATSTKPVDPKKPETTTWADWEATSTKPVDPKKPETTTWADWEATSTKPVDPKKPETTTWADWEAYTSKKPVDPKKPETTTWAEWDDTTTTVTATRTHTVTVTVYPVGSGTTWSQWNGPSTTGANDAVVTKTVSAEWSSNGWFGPTWTVDGQCAVNTITSYGEPAWKPTAGPAPSSVWSEWKETSTKPADPVKSTSVAWEEWSKTSTPSKSTGGVTANGDKFGLTYSPFTHDGKCKDKETVKSDVGKIAEKGFSSVRVYSTDCNTLEYVGDSCREHGLKVILGVFIDEKGIEAAQPQVDAIAKWAQWDLVELIVIGNEAVFNKRCTAEELGSFIASSKATFQGAGYDGLCTTTEELSVWQEHGQAWCDVVDVVAGNLYAFFNAETSADDAGDFIQSQIEILNGICDGKDSYVMESGWPSAGECNGKACPSPENQAKAIKGIQSTSGAKVVFFSFEDEAWKKPGDFGVEQHWGCAEVF